MNLLPAQAAPVNIPPHIVIRERTAWDFVSPTDLVARSSELYAVQLHHSIAS